MGEMRLSQSTEHRAGETNAKQVSRRKHDVDDSAENQELRPDWQGTSRIDELGQEGDEEHRSFRIQDLDSYAFEKDPAKGFE
jgi:hypothetical protein